MLRNCGPLVQALTGSLFTWGITALGAAGVFLLRSDNRAVIDASLGFSAGVMTAASFWSLLAPGIEIAQRSDCSFGYALIVAGFICGAAFVYVFDDSCFSSSSSHVQTSTSSGYVSASKASIVDSDLPAENNRCNADDDSSDTQLRKRRSLENANIDNREELGTAKLIYGSLEYRSWRRVLLLVVAITVHNIPEGLAVGVSFGAVGKSDSATFEKARNLAVGIAIQNFPEGLAVSLPLAAFGYSKLRSFTYGQMSGMVEPMFAMVGAYCVQLMESVLPFALAFAAGAMIYVVFDDVIPEAHSRHSSSQTTWMVIFGFLTMMSLDVLF